MRLLLDTHIWYWSLLEPSRLTRRVRDELASARNENWLSPISTWEILLLVSKGRILLLEDPSTWVTRATANFREAPLTQEIALAAHRLTFSHPDPADRFLAATAQVLDLILVTADLRLLGLRDIKTLANR